MDSDAKCNPVDSIGSSTESRVPIPNPRLLLGFQGTKTARREGTSSPFSDAGGCTSRRNSGAEIVKRPDDSSGFIVLPRRWVVERTFSWFGRNRRLAKDYENLADTLAAFITLACIQLAVRRLARP